VGREGAVGALEPDTLATVGVVEQVAQLRPRRWQKLPSEDFAPAAESVDSPEQPAVGASF
jgi:hypothetical protein